MAYRSELRELNEINFARFDSRLEQRIVESEAWLPARLAHLLPVAAGRPGVVANPGPPLFFSRGTVVSVTNVRPG